MEIQFQQPKQHLRPKGGKLKVRSRKSKPNKFVGVRQRPSGRWVAEIKDTTHKIRMWLGTFQTAEDAARAYDEAACLLRGSNTRTNFTTHVNVSSDSPLASRIRNLLNNRNGTKQQEHVTTQECYASSTSSPNSSNNNSENSLSSGTIAVTDGNCNGKVKGFEVHALASRPQLRPYQLVFARNSLTQSQPQLQFETLSTTQTTIQLPDDAYRPDMSNFMEKSEPGSEFNHSRYFEAGYDYFPSAQVMDIPKLDGMSEIAGMDLSEFERMKVERQISASLYAMNGVQEYMETVQDSNGTLWDLSPLCSFFC